MRKLFIIFSLLLSASPVFSNVKIQEITSPSGLGAWLVEEHSIPFIALNIAFRGGESMDRDGKRGAIELMMGMLEEGTGDLDAVAFKEAQEELGANFGFRSGRDTLTISAKIVTENTEASLALLRRAIQEPSFEKTAFERVKSQLLSIYRSDLTDANAILTETLFELAFPDHPYGGPLEGRVEELEGITADDLRVAHRDSFVREHVKISIVGDISPEGAGALIDELLADLPQAKRDLPKSTEIAVSGGGRIVDFEGPQSIASFMQKGLEFEDPDYFPAYIMNSILGGSGLSSRLNEEIREKRGLTYGVGSSLISFDHAALLLGSVASANEDIAEALELVREEWQKMREDGVSEDELARAKRYITGSYPLRFDGNAQIAALLTSMQTRGLARDYIETRNDRINAVTLEDIKRVAERLLRPEDLYFVVVGKPEGLEAFEADNP